MCRTPLIFALVMLTACGSSPIVNAPRASPAPELTGVTATAKTRQPNMLATLIADATRITVLPYSAKLNGVWQHHEADYQLLIDLSIGQLRIRQQGTETLLPVAVDSVNGKTVVLKIIGRDRSYTFRFVTDDVLEWDDDATDVKTLTRVTEP